MTLAVWDYAKVFLLSNRELMWVDGEDRNPVTLDNEHVSWFLPLEDPICGPPEPLRWREGVWTTHLSEHAGGNAVHYVLHDALGALYDVVYLTGGVTHGNDDTNQCPDAPATVLDLVERMVIGLTGESEPWNSVTPLRKSRFNSDMVVLLNGALWIDGGLGPTVTNVCGSRLRAEIYEPSEVFGPDADTQWRLMAYQQEARGYHSAAGLLTSGQAFAIGGQDSGQTVEVFNPPHLFKTPRPVIENPSTTLFYDTAFPNVTIRLRGTVSIDRVALLSPSSYTHANGFDQRYVDLRFTVQ